MNRRTAWTAVFLGLTGIVLGMEIWASVDTDPATVPWTDHITAHVPGEITASAIGALAFWLVAHFTRRYRTPPTAQE